MNYIIQTKGSDDHWVDVSPALSLMVAREIVKICGWSMVDVRIIERCGDEADEVVTGV